jgi:hypothetical protein
VSRFEAGPIVEAVVAHLEGHGWPVGDGEKSEGAEYPYAVVFDITGPAPEGSLDDDDDVVAVIQVSSHSDSAQGARWLGDHVRQLILDGSLIRTIDGRSVTYIRSDGSPGAYRDDASQPAIWFVPERFRFHTTPA